MQAPQDPAPVAAVQEPINVTRDAGQCASSSGPLGFGFHAVAVPDKEEHRVRRVNYTKELLGW